MDVIPSKTKVLVTDAGHKSALACVRSIGKKGFKVGCTGFPGQTLSFYSKYCYWKHLINIDQSKDHDEFLERYAQELLKIIKKSNYNVLIPVGLESYLTVSKHKGDFIKRINVSVVDWETMKIAYLKHESIRFASDVGVNVPKTIPIKSDEDITHAEAFLFPIVLKTSDSGAKSLKYCNDKDELVKNYGILKMVSSTPIIAQEYIIGPGHGFYALFNKGRLKAMFMHKRVKEYPITGGPSAVAKVYYNKSLMEQGLRLLKALKWHGPAMIEFKKDLRDGKFKLIEINPKLWGSLDLTITAGVDIPYLMVLQAMDIDFDPVIDFKKDIVYRWIFPDEFLATMAYPSTDQLLSFLKKRGNESTNIDVNDPLPVLIQFLRGATKFVIFCLQGKLKYPSGRPGGQNVEG